MLPDNIEQVIPHRGAMRWVERVLEWDEQSAVVELTVPLDGPFHQANGVPVWIGLEYMAQAIAAWAGCSARHHGQPSTKIGFLLGTRRYSVETSHFVPGTLLRVEARCELTSDEGLGIFVCRILKDEQVLASASVSVYQPDDARTQELLDSHAP
jgi:predicted hotdog family 3-hydroxylacyl-ACP dehydratase